jgi:hypothetical protein
MRLWSLHPKYLDPQGLVALWREALLAQAVLHNETRGYRNHPQLVRFKQCSSPQAAMRVYLTAIHAESLARGYRFERCKIKGDEPFGTLPVTAGQVAYEWAHLMNKLKARNLACYLLWQPVQHVEVHPLFDEVPGQLESWERT